MIVRPATTADLPDIIRIGATFTACIEASFIGFDPESLAETVIELINGDSGVVLVLDDNGVVGTAAGMVYPAYINKAHLTGQEVFWWVDPSHRGNGGLLLDALEDWARAVGADSFTMMSIEPLRTKIVNRIYERRDYMKHEHTFIKELH